MKRIYFILILFYFSTSIFATLKDGKKAFAQRQYQKAIKLFTEYSKENPSDGEPYMLMGYIYESEKDFGKSIQMFRKAVDLQLNAKYKKTSLVKILLYYQYVGNWDLVSHYANKLLKLDPNHREALKMKDRASANNGSDPGYIKVEEFSKKKPEDKKEKEEPPIKKEEPKIVKEEKSEPQLEQTREEKKWDNALSLIKKEEFQKADKVLMELINLNPSNKNYLYKAAMTKLRLGEYKLASEYFEKTKTLSDEINDKQLLYYVFLNQGQAEQKLGNINPALFLYLKAYEYNPNLTPLIPIMRINFENKDYAYARKISEEALKKDPNQKEALMYKSLTNIYLGEKKIGYKNLFLFNKWLNKNYPNLEKTSEKFQESLLVSGFYYTNRGKYKLGLKYLIPFSKFKPKNQKLIFALGKNYFYQSKFQSAEKNLEKIQEFSAANYLLAKIYSEKNDLTKTKEFLLKACNQKQIFWIKAKIDPSFKKWQSDFEFMKFLEFKGQPPKEEPVVIPAKTIVEEPSQIPIPEKPIEVQPEPFQPEPNRE